MVKAVGVPEMVYALLLSLAVYGSAADETPNSVSAVVTRLRARNERIQSIACRYSFSTTPSDFYISQRSKADGRSGDDVRRQYESLMDGAFEETRDGKFKFDLTRMDPQGQPKDRRSLLFDGKETFQIASLLSGGKAGFSDVTVKGNVRASYNVETQARRFLGDTVLPTTDQTLPQVRPLFAQIEGAEASEMLPGEALGGSECLVVRWQTADASTARRETVWLDLRCDLALRRYREELRPTGKDDWVVTARWEVEDLASASLSTSHEGPPTYWYPKEIVCSLFDLAGNLIFINKYNITMITLNSTIPGGRFTPQIEDGSNVIDAKSGRGFVYGKELSPRLRRMIHQQLDASKQGLSSEVDTRAADRVMTQRRRWTDIVSWTALAFGAVGVLGALWMRRRA
jgi:outer membrane lipoprotein-sorting protein